MPGHLLLKTLVMALALALAACGDQTPAVTPDAGPQDEETNDGGGDLSDGGDEFSDGGDDLSDGGDEPSDGGHQPESCGGRQGGACPTGEYCKFDLEDMCGAFDAPGVCTPIPEPICPPVVRPVCGCDGQTYSSACDAAAAGISVAAEGSCTKPGCEAQDAAAQGDPTGTLGFVWDGHTCVELVGSTCVGAHCDDVFWSKAGCLSHYLEAECYQPVVCGGRLGGACAEDEFCDFPDEAMCGAFDLPGICWPRPVARFCDVMDEQCGCDGETYVNACHAQASGVDVMYPGPCAEPECRAQNARGDGSSATLLGFAFNGYDCVEQFGQCEGPDCDKLFHSRFVCVEHYTDQGCIEPWPCNGAMSSCSPLDFCDYDDLNVCGLADGDGVCRPRPDGCGRVFEPVCGCDGETYSNDCEAARAGVDVAADGPCECQAQDASPVGLCKPIQGYWWNGQTCEAMQGCSCSGADCIEIEGDSRPPFADEAACQDAMKALGCTEGLTCGGRAGNTCDATEFCDFHVDGDCGLSDGTGVCKTRPEICLPGTNEVCGCDGETYTSLCEAQAAGTDVASAGACR